VKERIKGWLSSPNLLTRKPAIGWTMFVVGILVFALMAINLEANGPLIGVDTSVSNSLHNTALNISSGLLNFIKSGWDLGNEVAIGLALIMGVYFIARRYWQEFWMTAAGAGGGPLIFLILSHLFNRHRPEFAVPVASNPTGPGFPSGHTVIAMTLYGLIAYLLLPTISSRFGKWAVIVITLLIILFIGFSRIFTGGHYLTDVLAGYAVGLAWAGISYPAIEKYFVRRHKRRMENEKIEAKP
jgi:membrane-associated phospholipid phosphatase